MRLHAHRGDDAVNDRLIDAIDVVGPELRREQTLGNRRSRKDHQAARILVEAVNDSQRSVIATPAHPPQQRSSVDAERVLVTRLIGDAQHPGRLFDYDHVAVEKQDRAFGKRAGAMLECQLIDDNHRIRRDTRRRVEASLAIYRNAPLRAQLSGTGPRDAGLLAHDRRNGGLGRFHIDRNVTQFPPFMTRHGVADLSRDHDPNFTACC